MNLLIPWIICLTSLKPYFLILHLLPEKYSVTVNRFFVQTNVTKNFDKSLFVLGWNPVWGKNRVRVKSRLGWNRNGVKSDIRFQAYFNPDINLQIRFINLNTVALC